MEIYCFPPNHSAFTDRISQKYDVGGDQSPAKPPGRVAREYHSPGVVENLTHPAAAFVHLRELCELRKNSPEEQRNQQTSRHGTAALNTDVKSLIKAMCLCEILTPSRRYIYIFFC